MGIFVRITARTCKLEKCCNASHNGTKHFVPYKCYSFFPVFFCSRREGGDFDQKVPRHSCVRRRLQSLFWLSRLNRVFLGQKVYALMRLHMSIKLLLDYTYIGSTFLWLCYGYLLRHTLHWYFYSGFIFYGANTCKKGPFTVGHYPFQWWTCEMLWKA